MNTRNKRRTHFLFLSPPWRLWGREGPAAPLTPPGLLPLTPRRRWRLGRLSVQWRHGASLGCAAHPLLLLCVESTAEVFVSCSAEVHMATQHNGQREAQSGRRRPKLVSGCPAVLLVVVSDALWQWLWETRLEHGWWPDSPMVTTWLSMAICQVGAWHIGCGTGGVVQWWVALDLVL